MDLEAAIAFAPMLGDLDPRLHDEVLDWCIQFAGHFVSVTALKHCLKLFHTDHRQRFDRFAAIVNTHARTKWPTAGAASLRASAFAPSGKSRCRLDAPASVQLRARKIFGINARADILVGLALLPDSPELRWTHVNLLLDLGYTKRSLSEALNDLRLGGTLGSMKFGNTIRYRLLKRDPLRDILAPIPETAAQPWAQRLALAASPIDVERRTRTKSLTTRAVDARKVLEQKRSTLSRSFVSPPELGPGDPWPQIERWMEPMLRP